MRTACRLFLVFAAFLVSPARVVPCLLAVALAVTPAAAQRVVHLMPFSDLEVPPVLGTITDDPGPFNRIAWNPEPEVNYFYVPPSEEEAGVVGDSPTPPPTLKFNPVSGHALAVWTAPGGERARGFDLLFSRFAVGGWSAPVTLAAGAADPALSIDPVDGAVHLVYWTPGAGGGVWHRQAPADLRIWSDAVRVSDIDETATRPTVLVHGGRLRVAYESHLVGLGSTPREIVLAERVHEPNFSRTVLAMTYHAGRNWVRLDSDGRHLLVRWVNAGHQAGWIVQGQEGVWGPVGSMPLPGAETDTRSGRLSE